MKTLLIAALLTVTAAGCISETQASVTVPQPVQIATAPQPEVVQTVVVQPTVHPVVAAVEAATVRATVWTALDIIFHHHR